MSPSVVIGASPCFSRPTTIASTGDWSPRQRGAPAQLSETYCLMPNHVHLPIMPTWRDAGGRGRVAGNLCRSAPALHRGHQRSLPVDGRLFEGRFRAVVMDEPHLSAAARHIALNPVVAGLVSRAEDR